MKKLNIVDAIAYVTGRSDKAKTWANPRRNIEQHVNRRNLAHAAKKRTRGKALLFSTKELDRFILWLDNHPLPKGGRRFDLSDYMQHLGKLPDNQVAKMAGCHRSTVFRRRHALNIPAAPRPAAKKTNNSTSDKNTD